MSRLALNIDDLHRIARGRLPRGMYEFIERGTEDDVATRANKAAYAQFSLRPQVLRDVSKRDTTCELFGRPMAMPVIVAPTGAAGLMWYEGELAVARAAAAAAVPFTLSTASLTSMERIAAEAPGRLWFQLYMWPDRTMSHDLVRRAQAAGFEALMVTVDTAVAPNREFNVHNGFSFPFRLNARNAFDILAHPRWLLSVIARYKLTTGMPKFENFPKALQQSLTGGPKGRPSLPKNDALRWEDFRDLRRLWAGPLMIKGILHPDDAEMAVRCGADAVIVSNHGGRNLDTSIAPLLALEDILEQVGGRIPVLVDGGITRGSDVVKALALGAKAVLSGRAPLWGLATNGEAGVAQALSILREETRRVLGQVGCSKVGELGPHLLWRNVPRGEPVRAGAGGTSSSISSLQVAGEK